MYKPPQSRVLAVVLVPVTFTVMNAIIFPQAEGVQTATRIGATHAELRKKRTCASERHAIDAAAKVPTGLLSVKTLELMKTWSTDRIHTIGDVVAPFAPNAARVVPAPRVTGSVWFVLV